MSVLDGALQDLNDLYFFAAVVEHGGFSAAGRALGIPKSRLSKRIAQLEDRLGVRLLQRTCGQSRVLIVASPKLMEQTGRPKLPSDLSTIPALAMNEHEGAHSWELLVADNERVVVDIQPRLICGDFSVLLESARRGIGVALLPEFVCAQQLPA